MGGERCSPHRSLTSHRSPSGHLATIISAPRRLQETSKLLFVRLRTPPRAIQEPFKRLSAAITQLRSNPMPVYIEFDPQNRPRGLKNQWLLFKTIHFEDIAFSFQVVSWTRFWTLLASVSGAFWPPRWLKPVLEFLLERPRAVQDFFFRPQRRPKRRPRAPHKPLEGPPWPTKPF